MEEKILDSQISNELKRKWNWAEKILIFCQIGFVLILSLWYYYFFHNSNLLGEYLYSLFPVKIVRAIYFFIVLGYAPQFFHIFKYPTKAYKVKPKYLHLTPLIQLLLLQFIQLYFN